MCSHGAKGVCPSVPRRSQRELGVDGLLLFTRTAGDTGLLFQSRPFFIQAGILVLELGQVFVVIFVFVRPLVFFEVGAVSLLGDRGLGLELGLDVWRKLLPLLSDALCDLSKGKVLGFEVFADSCCNWSVASNVVGSELASGRTNC